MHGKRSLSLFQAAWLVVGVSVLGGCAAAAPPRQSALVGTWTSKSGSTLELTSGGEARFSDFPRAAVRLEATGEPVDGSASWRVMKQGHLIRFTGNDMSWAAANRAEWTATVTDDSPPLIVFVLRNPDLETSEELALHRDR
jgi:hypothetical protein